MSQLQLSLLGEPIVKHGEHTLTFSTRKALALLVYLAVEGGTHTRKTLSESFWPELDAEHGRAALRATLLELRKLLERCHGPGERAHLQVERDTLGLAQDNPLILDLRLVESVSKQVGRRVEPLAGEMDGELLAQLEQATRLARGPFLAGFTLRDSQFFDDWTRQHREYWHLRVQQLFDALSRLYERAGDGERAIAIVSHWLGFDRLHEEGYRRLMQLRFSQGDRAGALRAYADCRAVLAEELQVEPEPETVALAKRIRHTAPFRPAQSQSPHSSPRQSPAHLLDGPYLGRSDEFGTLIECYQRVHAGQSHLVLLQGETGIGKTRLASEFLGWAQAQGAEVLAGQALQTGRQLPYQPLIDVLRHRLKQEHAPDDLVSDVWLAELACLLPELRVRYPDLPIPSTDEALGHSRLFEATARFVQIWAARRPLVLLLDDMQWAAEQQPEAENNSSTDGCPDRYGSSTGRERVASFANWLYAQTRGQPFYLVETLKGLLEQEIIVPSLQQNGTWGLVLRSGLLAQTPGSELIPASLRELIRSQLGQLTTSAWALLVAGAVMGTGLTFERLCQVAQVDEETGLHALEELLRSGLLCEGNLAEESQAFDAYIFPREVIREVVYQEAGATRQRLVQRRVSAVMQEGIGNDRGEVACLPHSTPVDGYASAETRNGQGRLVMAGAVSGGMGAMRWAVAKDSSGVARRHVDTGIGERTLMAAWARDAAAQTASAFPRSPPDSPARVFCETCLLLTDQPTLPFTVRVYHAGREQTRFPN